MHRFAIVDLYSRELLAFSQLTNKTNRSWRDLFHFLWFLITGPDIERRSKVEFLEVLDQSYLLIGQGEQYHISHGLSRLLADWSATLPIWKRISRIGILLGGIPHTNASP